MIIIRKATKQDVPFIEELENRYLDCPWTKEQIADEIVNENSIFLIACEDGQNMGYAFGDVIVDCLDMCNIVVDKHFRRLGVAYLLLHELERIARACRCVQSALTVRNDNIEAIALYKKSGYSEVGIRRDYYKGKDGITMIKDITGN